MCGKRSAAVASVPDRAGSSDAPSLRGKNSYQAPTRARRRCTRNGHGPLTDSSVRCPWSFIADATPSVLAAASRTGAGRRLFRIAASAALSVARTSVAARGSRFSVRLMMAAPSANSNSTSIPSAILMCARCFHARQGSDQAWIEKVQLPISSTVIEPAHRSTPDGSGCIRTAEACRPAGSVVRTSTVSGKCPSRKTVARTGTVSPTAAAAGRSPHCTLGQTSTMGIREVRPSCGPVDR